MRCSASSGFPPISGEPRELESRRRRSQNFWIQPRRRLAARTRTSWLRCLSTAPEAPSRTWPLLSFADGFRPLLRTGALADFRKQGVLSGCAADAEIGTVGLHGPDAL